MIYSIVSKFTDISEAESIIVPVWQSNEQMFQSSSFRALDTQLDGFLTQATTLEQFTGKSKRIFHCSTGRSKPRHIILVGLGSLPELSVSSLLSSFASSIRVATSKKSSLVSVVLPTELVTLYGKHIVHHCITATALGSYTFNKYKPSAKEENNKEISSCLFYEETPTGVTKQDIEQYSAIAEAVLFARDCINEPPSDTTPQHLATVARGLTEGKKNMSCVVYGKKEMSDMGMGGILGIARGSDKEPQFIHMTYQGGGKKTIVLIGKGITFDSGGLSLKPGNAMETMKMDMSGAAAVLGVFRALQTLQPQITVHGLISSTENMIGPDAVKPGDILTAMNGKTMEILNTDAEGRVVLADALSYAGKKIKADAIIDLATLTGACLVALGEDVAGLFVNDMSLGEQLKKSAQETGERIWELPLVPEYKELMKSHVADIKNISSTRYAGAITGALFLEAFVPEKTPWAHLDIAGPAFAEKDAPLTPYGGTGFGIRMPLQYILS